MKDCINKMKQAFKTTEIKKQQQTSKQKNPWKKEINKKFKEGKHAVKENRI